MAVVHVDARGVNNVFSKAEGIAKSSIELSLHLGEDGGCEVFCAMDDHLDQDLNNCIAVHGRDPKVCFAIMCAELDKNKGEGNE